MGVIIIVLVSITAIFGERIYMEIQYNRRFVSEINETDANYYSTSFRISDFVVFEKENGACEINILSTFYKDYNRSYSTNESGCYADPLYYLQIDGDYLTLNQAVDQGFITHESVKTEFLPYVNCINCVYPK